MNDLEYTRCALRSDPLPVIDVGAQDSCPKVQPGFSLQVGHAALPLMAILRQGVFSRVP